MHLVDCARDEHVPVEVHLTLEGACRFVGLSVGAVVPGDTEHIVLVTTLRLRTLVPSVHLFAVGEHVVALVVAHLDQKFGQGVDRRHVAHRHLRVLG